MKELLPNAALAGLLRDYQENKYTAIKENAAEDSFHT